MMLCEELYFEINLKGKKSDLKKFVSFIKSGEADEFFEVSSDYIHYDDEFASASDDEESSIIFSNDDYGIEIDEFDTREFLEMFCLAAKDLDVEGRLFDIDDEEFCFASEAGDSYYINTKSVKRFNDELDEVAAEEESEED